MKIDELNEIIKQLKKYNLLENIEDVSNWFSKLNAKQIKNFISLNIEIPKELSEFKYVLISLNLLDSDYYNYDINLIFCKEVNKDIIPVFIKTVCDVIIVKSEHHEKDMEMISRCESEEMASILSDVAVDVDSLSSDHHAQDMEMISMCESVELASVLADVAVDVDSLSSDHHVKDMEEVVINYKNGSLNKQQEPDGNRYTKEQIVDFILDNAKKCALENGESAELPNDVFSLTLTKK